MLGFEAIQKQQARGWFGFSFAGFVRGGIFGVGSSSYPRYTAGEGARASLA